MQVQDCTPLALERLHDFLEMVVHGQYPDAEIEGRELDFAAGVKSALCWFLKHPNRMPEWAGRLGDKVRAAGYRNLPHEIAKAEHDRQLQEIERRLSPVLASCVARGRMSHMEAMENARSAAIQMAKHCPALNKVVEGCDLCGQDHPAWAPHDHKSELLRNSFLMAAGLQPTWESFLAPCPEPLQAKLVTFLARLNISITDVADDLGVHEIGYAAILSEWRGSC